MSEMSCHRLKSSWLNAMGNESPKEAASFELRASSCLVLMIDFTKDADKCKTWLQAASYKLQVSCRKTFQYMRDFKRLLIWQRGMAIVTLVYKVVKFLPKEERYGLQLQMTKSAVSIPSNIAEGSAKRSQKDYLRFVEISLGSAYELETQSLVIKSQGWAPANLINDLLNQVEQEQRMISKFMEKL